MADVTDLQDVTVQEWDELVERVRGAVREIQAREDSPVLDAILADLENPTSDFVNVVVEHLVRGQAV